MPWSFVDRFIMAKKTAEPESQEEQAYALENVLKSVMTDKANLSKHLNDIPQIEYSVSTGSLVWDEKTDGGIPPGIQRLIGPPESGKSSAALEICRNFLLKLPTGRGIYIKSEGRLSRQMRERCGLKFVWNYEEWKDGTIFVLESNNYEFIINLLLKLVKIPHEFQRNYLCIIFDSMDGLSTDADLQKTLDQNDKVAGAPALTKRFLQKMGNDIGVRGHLALLLSQFSSNIDISQYTGVQDKRAKYGSGGWASAHWANYIFEFKDASSGEIIKEHKDLPPGPKNKIYGKTITVKFSKTPNETTGSFITYPIQYGVVGKSSIWSALEIYNVLVMWGMVKPGAWITMPSDVIEAVSECGLEIPEKFNGERKFCAWLEANHDVCECLRAYFRKKLIAIKLSKTDGDIDPLADETQESQE
jgi:RecA/RadA recombinase